MSILLMILGVLAVLGGDTVRSVDAVLLGFTMFLAGCWPTEQEKERMLFDWDLKNELE